MLYATLYDPPVRSANLTGYLLPETNLIAGVTPPVFRLLRELITYNKADEIYIVDAQQTTEINISDATQVIGCPSDFRGHFARMVGVRTIINVAHKYSYPHTYLPTHEHGLWEAIIRPKHIFVDFFGQTEDEGGVLQVRNTGTYKTHQPPTKPRVNKYTLRDTIQSYLELGQILTAASRTCYRYRTITITQDIIDCNHRILAISTYPAQLLGPGQYITLS